MNSISKKVNNDTIEVMNKIYKELYTLQCKRSYILKENKYDDNIEKCIGELFKSLDTMYLSIIEKEPVEEMEGDMEDKMEVYDDSGIPDIQGTFDECITPRTPRTVQEPSTPTAPVKARKKIIVEEHDLEDNDVEDNDVEDNDVEEESEEEEEDNVLNHIMNYSDDSDNDSENSYEKLLYCENLNGRAFVVEDSRVIIVCLECGIHLNESEQLSDGGYYCKPCNLKRYSN